MSFSDLQSFVRALEGAGELRRISTPVDPELEITEIYDRVIKREGPALLFENVRGSQFPLLINALGSPARIELALGRPPEQIGEALLDLAAAANPPSPRRLWKLRSTVRDVLGMRTRRARKAPCQEVVEEPDLTRLPVQTCWPDDGGPFITWGMAFTCDPVSGERNVGLYRVQVFDERTAGIHWQLHKGGGFHYVRAENLDRPLEMAVVIGADPALLLAAVTALPEGMDEVAFSGLLRRMPCRMVKCKTIDMEVPANAEFVLEGVVPPGERRLEGPFGDHFGHYSHAAPFPVFHVQKMTRRKNPIYMSATVGKPPQEDKHIGNAVQETVGPLIKLIHPEVNALWAYYETGFHNLLVVSMERRYFIESVRTALGLMGTGQLALTKCCVLVNGDVDVRDFSAVLGEIRKNFDPAHDFLLMPKVPQDTLDFTSYSMNLGSKMILDATSGFLPTLHGTPGADRDAVLAAIGDAVDLRGLLEDPELGEHFRSSFDEAEVVEGIGLSRGGSPDSDGAGTLAARGAQPGDAIPDPKQFDDRITESVVLDDCLMVVKVAGQGRGRERNESTSGSNLPATSGREVVEKLVREPLGSVRIVAAVSEDVPFNDHDLLLWGIFTRFDCARDVVFTRVERRDAWTTCHGTMGIDATFKPGYPEPLEMSEEMIARVDRRWEEYGID
jgi:UbiD family decarboxylase